jgi:hypothetical protein
MTSLRWAVRFVCLAGALVVLLLLLAVQAQQRVLRWRAEQLSGDMHQIRLYQSNWADAQRLMKRWGRWGYHEGSCTAQGCRYTIELADLSFYTPHTSRHAWIGWLLLHDHYNLYHWLGGRGAAFKASFTVQNGTIWRESEAIGVVVSTRTSRSDDVYDKTLYLSAQSRERLHRTLEDPFSIMGSDEQLAEHPYYKVGRPGGCKINCQMASVSYSTHTPPGEIERLSSYEFSCFTQFHACAELGDVLPAAREWHLYDEETADALAEKRNSLPQIPCGIPIWALARDARYVLAVEVLSSEKKTEQNVAMETASVRILASLKVPSPWLLGTIEEAYPFPGNSFELPPQQAEQLVPGERFIVFPVGDDRRDQRLSKDSPIRLDRCGVQKDNDATRQELQIGFAQNDTLRSE